MPTARSFIPNRTAVPVTGEAPGGGPGPTTGYSDPSTGAISRLGGNAGPRVGDQFALTQPGYSNPTTGAVDRSSVTGASRAAMGILGGRGPNTSQPTSAAVPPPSTPAAPPTFNPGTPSYQYVQAPGVGTTSYRPNMDTYVAQGMQAYLNAPPDVRAASGFKTDPWTELAQQYEMLYPGQSGDVNAAIARYKDQYSGIANQQITGQNASGTYNLGPLGGNEPNPAYSYYAPQAGQTPAPATPPPATPPQTPSPEPPPTQIDQNYWSNILLSLFGRGSARQPTWGTYQTPLGYTQYQQTVPQGLSGNDLMNALISMYSNGPQTSPYQSSFWDLLNGRSSNPSGGSAPYNPGTPEWTPQVGQQSIRQFNDFIARNPGMFDPQQIARAQADITRRMTLGLDAFGNPLPTAANNYNNGIVYM